MAIYKEPLIGEEEPENEKRFLVRSIDPHTFSYPSIQVVQGYLDSQCRHNGLRIRLIDGQKGILTRKVGHGRHRLERNQETQDLAAVKFLLQSTDEKIRKTRFYRDGWEIDRFQDELSGVILAEFETEDPQAEVTLPPWISEAVEVTSYLSNRDLARLVTFLKGQPPVPNLTELICNRLPRIVLTGGPCSGKSTMMRSFAADKEFGPLFHFVPEVATVIIGQVGCKPPVGDPVAIGLFQEAVFRTQKNFEIVAQIQAWRDRKTAILLDRGTGDNAAYVSGGWDDLSRMCKTSQDYEYRQYDLVICLEVPPAEVFEENRRNNPARTETYEQAVALGRKIELAWGDHPGYHFVRNTPDTTNGMADKMAAARKTIARFCDDLKILP